MTVDSIGNISAAAGSIGTKVVGIDATSFTSSGAGHAGDVEVSSDGDVAATNAGADGTADGISARSLSEATAAGAVAVESDGDITVSAAGDSAHGIYALSRSVLGSGGVVTIENTGDITVTSSFSAFGISAESQVVDFSSGNAGAVSIDSQGTVVAAAEGRRRTRPA